MTEQLQLSDAFRNFVIHIRAPDTRINYISRLGKFMAYCGVNNHDHDALLFDNDTKKIQSLITDFLIHLRAQDLAPRTIRGYAPAIRFFYEMNDITGLNWRKIHMTMGEDGKRGNDRPYTTEEIARMLEKVDQRGRCVILLMCSSGMRQGAIHSLKVGHTKIEQNQVYQIIVYKNTPDEYTTFCSYECTEAINRYLEYRSRCGEKITPASPLIREQFDKNDPMQCASPRHVGVGAIEDIIYTAIYDAGLREKKNVVKGQKKVLHDVMQSHGLRKFFNTSVVMAGMQNLYAEMLMGHRNGLAMQSYVKPTVGQMLAEYLKVVDSVTINEEHKLRREVKTLKEENTKIEKALAKIDNIYEKLGLGL